MAEGTGKKASDLFIECLEEEGCEYVFGVPGEENLDFLDSLSRSRQIKLILTRHEQGAGFMAATYGRHTGKTGVCVATLGPGATNFGTPSRSISRAVVGETTASDGAATSGRSKVCASICHVVDTTDEPRVRRVGTSATSSRWKPRRALRPSPISTVSGMTSSLPYRCPTGASPVVTDPAAS